MFLAFKNGIISMQTAGYNGACIVVLVCWFDSKGFIQHILDSGIDVGQGIHVGPGKFGKKNKRRALNKHLLCSK